MKKSKIKASNCEIHKKEIIKRWKEGETVIDLVKRFHCHNTYITRLLIETVGEEKYLEGCKKRTGRGMSKYNTYPDWLTEKAGDDESNTTTGR